MTQQELDALKALAARDESAVPLCSEYRQGIVALIAEVERLQAAARGRLPTGRRRGFGSGAPDSRGTRPVAGEAESSPGVE